MINERAIELIRIKFPKAIRTHFDFRGDTTLIVEKEFQTGLLHLLRDDPGLHFDFLVDITCVDYLAMEEDAAERFHVVYVLFSYANRTRLIVKVPVSERDCRIPSVSTLWPVANWLEREVFDLFGIEFTGHPDLRRILMPEGYDGHPLRKDYPLEGRGERDSLQILQRIAGQEETE